MEFLLFSHTQVSLLVSPTGFAGKKNQLNEEHLNMSYSELQVLSNLGC
jgi:hypothetical protein